MLTVDGTGGFANNSLSARLITFKSSNDLISENLIKLAQLHIFALLDKYYCSTDNEVKNI